MKQIGSGQIEEKDLGYEKRLEQNKQKRRNQDMKTDWSREDKREETRILKQIGAGKIEEKKPGY